MQSKPKRTFLRKLTSPKSSTQRLQIGVFMGQNRLSVFARCLGASVLVAALSACGKGTSSVGIPGTVASLSGSYVFSVTGTSSVDGDYSVLGSFVADGKGNITSAIADYNLGSGVDYDVPLTGTYIVGNGTAVINLTDSASVNDSLITTLVTSGTAPIQNYDGNGSGTLYAQNTAGFTPAGTYSFSVTGEGQGTVTGSGQFVAGSSGVFTGGNLTYADAETSTTYSSVSGFIGAPETGGRGLANIEGHNLSYYVIGPNQIQMMGLDERALLTIPAQKQ